MQSAYTSAIERSLLKWNGRDCDGSMHYAIEFYCCHVTTFWNLIGTANFQAAEVTVWTRGSCQAVSPTAWERGYCTYGHTATNSSTIITYNTWRWVMLL